MLLSKEIDEIKSLLQHYDATNEKISAVSVGWQLDHSLRVINSVINVMKKSDPSEYTGGWNSRRFYIFLRGSIPRGAGKAPKQVVSKTSIRPATIEQQILIAEDFIKEFETLPAKVFFKHPYFGNLHKKRAAKFLGIHTRHHLKIARDILKG